MKTNEKSNMLLKTKWGGWVGPDGPFTYQDLTAFPEDGNRYEIIEGELFTTPAPFDSHQRVVGNLYYILRDFLKKGVWQGIIRLSPYNVILSGATKFEPDLLLLSEANQNRIREDGCHGPPDLIIEVLSRGTEDYDKGAKLAAYMEYNVREIWLVDPEKETISVYTNNQGRQEWVGSFSKEETLQCSVFNSISFHVKEAFVIR